MAVDRPVLPVVGAVGRDDAISVAPDNTRFTCAYRRIGQFADAHAIEYDDNKSIDRHSLLPFEFMEFVEFVELVEF